MKIYILGGELINPGDLSWDCFNKYGDVVVINDVDMCKLPEIIADADVLVGVPDEPFGEKELKYAKNLGYIGLFSAGYDHVDLEFCSKRGIVVCNNPGYGSSMVSQYAISLLLEICCNISKMNEVVHLNKWNQRAEYVLKYPEIELFEKTMGIIGFGRIGRITGRIAQAFGMNVLYNDVAPVPEEENDKCRFSSLDNLLQSSDVVVLHCPLFPETENIINAKTLAKMKDGVILINNARGALVDEKALYDALCSGKVMAAGLDVTRDEPIKADNPLLTCSNCIITPHFSWLAKETRSRIITNALHGLEQYLEGSPVHRVN